MLRWSWLISVRSLLNLESKTAEMAVFVFIITSQIMKSKISLHSVFKKHGPDKIDIPNGQVDTKYLRESLIKLKELINEARSQREVAEDPVVNNSHPPSAEVDHCI